MRVAAAREARMGLRPAGRARAPEEAPRGVAPRAALRARRRRGGSAPRTSKKRPQRWRTTTARWRRLKTRMRAISRRARGPCRTGVRARRGVRLASVAPRSKRRSALFAFARRARPSRAPRRLAPHVGEAQDAAEQRVPAARATKERTARRRSAKKAKRARPRALRAAPRACRGADISARTRARPRARPRRDGVGRRDRPPQRGIRTSSGLELGRARVSSAGPGTRSRCRRTPARGPRRALRAGRPASAAFWLDAATPPSEVRAPPQQQVKGQRAGRGAEERGQRLRRSPGLTTMAGGGDGV